MSNNFTAFTTDFNQGDLINSSSSSVINGFRLDSPKGAGDIERIVIRVEKASIKKPYIFAIRSYDDLYAYSAISNYAQAVFVDDFITTSQQPSRGLAIVIASVVIVLMIILVINWIRINYWSHSEKKNKHNLILI